LLHDKNKSCKSYEKITFLLQKTFYSVHQCDTYTDADAMLKEYPNYFNIVILFATSFSTEPFLFINKLKKINKNIQYINITEEQEFKFESIHCLYQPINEKELLEKIYNLCIFDYTILDMYLSQVEKEYKEQKTALELSKDDLVDMAELIDDFETSISELIYTPDMKIGDINLHDTNVLLQKTYNVFYIFIDEEIKSAIEPFSIALLSFIDTIHSLQINEDNLKIILDSIVLILEDILKFIQSTVQTEHYIHSKYLMDSFISNIEYLKIEAGLLDVAEAGDDLEFF
jgi:arsenate reductase-like glutaredoxin family protein